MNFMLCELYLNTEKEKPSLSSRVPDTRSKNPCPWVAWEGSGAEAAVVTTEAQAHTPRPWLPPPTAERCLGKPHLATLHASVTSCCPFLSFPGPPAVPPCQPAVVPFGPH